MELGQRIKAARLAAGLSQRQLCGTVCTRNMLSLIESGKARPSMETLGHFARELGKPISWFLEEQVSVSPNQQVMAQVEKALAEGDYSAGLEALGNYRGPDPVFDNARYFLEIGLLLELAEQAVAQRKLPYAKGLLDRIGRVGANTVYPWDRQRWILLRHKAGEQAAELEKQLTDMDDRLQLLAQAAADRGEMQRAEDCLAAVEQRTEEWHLCLGQVLLAQRKYAAAAVALQVAEQQYPAQCIPLLEVCYRELGDFQQAYAYACKARDVE